MLCQQEVSRGLGKEGSSGATPVSPSVPLEHPAQRLAQRPHMTGTVIPEKLLGCSEDVVQVGGAPLDKGV